MRQGWTELKGKLSGLAVGSWLQQWMSTLDYQALFYDRTVDPTHADFLPPQVFVFWHEYIPCPFYLRPNCDIAMLVSRHRDADILSEAARYSGFRTIRGSTKRGGDAAMRELIRASKTASLAITPDGPRGPRRKLAPGCIFLASKLQLPLVPFGIGYDRPWRLPTWDRFAMPRPFSRARIVVGPRLSIPAELTRPELEQQRQHVEAVLNQLTEEAESWAVSGERRVGQFAVTRQAMPLRPQDPPPYLPMLSDASTDGLENVAKSA
jgi:lysophospholipid acyltransferase (LPLAT)-like uncharacterized protein